MKTEEADVFFFLQRHASLCLADLDKLLRGVLEVRFDVAVQSTSSSPSFGAGIAHPNGSMLPGGGSMVGSGPGAAVSGMIPTPMSNGNLAGPGGQAPSMPVQMHETPFAEEWTAEEQRLLEEGLSR